jgi:ribosomal protein S18 acetylase RimI-like enzyme
VTTVVATAPHDAGAGMHAGVRDLLREVDAEFVPPLSHRVDTLALHGPTCPPEDGLSRYLDAVGRESWLVALRGDRVVGLLSYLTDHRDPWLAAYSPSLYATTVAVSVSARRAGVGGQLYDAFEAAAHRLTVPYLTTRTWTSNAAHLRLLRDRGWRRVVELPDDRDAGVGTVYYARVVGTGGATSSGQDASATARCMNSDRTTSSSTGASGVAGTIVTVTGAPGSRT